MSEKAHSCETCKFRKHAEEKPKTFLAWLWRLHAKICPGWRSYQKHLARSEKPE
jgi:hypothetical protein